jgi:hypothetical protein
MNIFVRTKMTAFGRAGKGYGGRAEAGNRVSIGALDVSLRGRTS